MSGITWSGHNVVIGIEGLQEVERELGNLKRKTPAVVKFAVNKTARQARKMMIMQAKARYAINAAGARHLDDLAQRKKASNSSLSAELLIKSLRNDLGYFQTNPSTPYIGKNVFNAPDVFTGRVLKESAMKPLTGTAKLGKGFLVQFSSGHVGMVQRQLGSDSKHRVTAKGYKRWTTRDGRVEKLRTMGSPSATAMHNTVWPMVAPDVEAYLAETLITRCEQVLALAAARTKRGK
jgi:hypothetical protein